MLTKNAKAFMNYLMTGYRDLASQEVRAYTGARYTSGSIINTFSNIGTNLMNNVKTTAFGAYSSSVNGVWFGSGTTPPSADDYSLSGNMVKDFTHSVSLQTTRNDNGSVTMTATYSLTSTASTDIVIGEIGMFICTLGVLEGSTVSNKTYPVLIDRAVFPTPITIPPGGFGQVVYTFTYDPSGIV